MTGPHVTRRGLLTGTGALVGATLLGPGAALAAGPPAGRLVARRLEGTDASVALLPGDATTVLTHVARRFSYEIATLGEGDAQGSDAGTALTLLATRLPRGAQELFPYEVRVVRDVLADCQGVVRWGGDDAVPQQGVFALDVSPGDDRLARAAAALAAGPGAGAPVDVLDPVRLRAAAALERAQRVS